MDLSDGSAWFSDWFAARLSWTEPTRRSAFSDLRPFVSPDTWDSLLRMLRAHLEEQAPLDTEFQVRLADGRVERWHMRGAAQRNEVGHPTHCAGIVREVSTGGKSD